MRILVFFVLMCGAAVVGRAQQNYFVYLQTDNKQPFYVRVNDKLFSSSASGYVVIPKLQTGTHLFSVGFPKNEWPLQAIPVSVTTKDQGYLLKNFESKGWGLFNIQTLEVVMANAKPGAGAGQPVVVNRTDDFSSTLADVVNTPSIKEVEKAAVKEAASPKTPETTTPTAPATKDVEPIIIVKKDSTTIAATDAVPIRKMSEANTAEGRLISYLVQNDAVADTVTLVISPDVAVQTNDTTTARTPAYSEPPAPIAKVDTPAATSPRFIEIELTNPNSARTNDTAAIKSNDSVGETAIPSTPTGTSANAIPNTLKMINSDCRSSAGEDDFIRIRKKMISQKTEDQMIAAAEKMFRQKCYSVEQVKNLSVLLLKEESKYKLFDTAYPFVHDSSNFRTLESQLADPYFISRFKAMIRN